VAVVVPRYRRKAVERNRVKRRIREILRVEVLPRLSEAGLALDVLVRARPEAYAARFVELKEELVRWVERRCSGRSSSR
jgi:ribonuclease P protein component